MRCPQCKNKVLQKSGTATRLRTQGPLTFDDSGCHGQCYWCNTSITLPLKLTDGVAAPAERFVLRKP